MQDRERNRFGSPGLRLIQLYILLISSGRPYSLTRLTKMMTCSRQTILRMIEQIGMIKDVDCRSWMEKNERFYQIDAQPAPASLVLDADALRHLALCRDIVGHLLPDPFRGELHATLNAVSDGAPNRAGPLPSVAEPWVKGHIDYTPSKFVLEKVQLAMAEHRLCRILYDARSSGKRIPYLVAPLLIIAYREALYLRCRIYDAHDKPTHRYRTLAIQRIKNFRPTEKEFTAAPETDRDPNFGFPFHEPIQVKVAFWGSAAVYVSERIWSPGQTFRKRKDGALLLTFTATSRLEVISWVLSFGPDAELLEPAELRAELKIRAEGILMRYATTNDTGGTSMTKKANKQ